MFITLFILMLVQGLVFSDVEDKNNHMSCFALMEKEDKANFTDVLPNGEDILHHCPDVKEYIDCLIRTVSDTGLFFNLDDLLKIRSFLNDICNETSQLYKDYVNNFDCFKSMMDKWHTCKRIASDSIEEFRNSGFTYDITHLGDLYAVEEEDLKEFRTFAEEHCLLNGHTSACIGKEMQESCGQGTYEMYVEIMTRGRFTNELCDGFSLRKLMKGYLDYLSGENKTTEINILRDLFEMNTD